MTRKYGKKTKTLLKYGLISLFFILLIITIRLKIRPNSASLICSSDNKIGVEILEKKLEEIHGADYLFLKIKFFNKTKKNIDSTKGNITFSDLDGNQIYSINLGYPRFPRDTVPKETISSNSSTEEDYPINYVKYVDELSWLNDAKLGHMDCKWNVHEIIYEDGTQENFL